MTITRRRFLTISAAAGCLGARAMAQARWHGRALGANASMQLVGLSDGDAAAIFAAVSAEITRLEQIFSLYQTDSDLMRLNRGGRLDAPSADMLAVLSLAASIHRATDGAFDPTVQSLWQAYADALTTNDPPDVNDLPFGWSAVQFDARAVTFDKPGMALTLNGIAQGYVTDRVNAVLADHGLTDILIDIGEVAARGAGSDLAPWQAGIRGTSGQIVQRVQLNDRALATSAPYSLMLEPASGTGHILHPALRVQNSLVAVSAPTAAVADALSTAGVLMPRDGFAAAVAAFPASEIIHITQKGRS